MGKSVALKLPSSPDLRVRSVIPVPWLIISTSAPEITAPLASLIVPEIAPVLPPCANPDTVSARITNNHTRSRGLGLRQMWLMKFISLQCALGRKFRVAIAAPRHSSKALTSKQPSKAQQLSSCCYGYSYLDWNGLSDMTCYRFRRKIWDFVSVSEGLKLFLQPHQSFAGVDCIGIVGSFLQEYLVFLSCFGGKILGFQGPSRKVVRTRVPLMRNRMDFAGVGHRLVVFPAQQLCGSQEG